MARYNKTEKSWILYDCTISTYSMILITTIFPLYLRMVLKQQGAADAYCTSYWGYLNSAGRFIIAILAPILGTIADYKGYKMKFFKVFCIIGIVFTGLLGIVPDSMYILISVVFVISTIGNSESNVFYDAFLVDVTEKENMDMLSSIGFAAGYLGNIIAFAICMMIVILAQKHFIPIDISTACKMCFIVTCVWTVIFSVPILKNVKQVYGIEREPKIVINSFKRIAATFANVKKHKNLFIYLLAYFFYIDGVNTIITMATSFGADVGIDSSSMLIVLLMTMVVAFPCTILYGKLAKKFGTKNALYGGIIIYSVICIYSNFVRSIAGFWILAMLVGTSQGGIQAISRSYFGKLVPKERNNEFFGFFNIFGRFAAIMGPLLVGIVTQITGKSSNGLFSILILFLLGGIILIKVKDTEKNTDNENDFEAEKQI